MNFIIKSPSPALRASSPQGARGKLVLLIKTIPHDTNSFERERVSFPSPLGERVPKGRVRGIIFAKIVNKLQKQIDVNRFSLINRKNKSLFISFRGFFCNFEGESHFRANGQRSKVKGLIRRP